MSLLLSLGSFPNLRRVTIVVDVAYRFTLNAAHPAPTGLDESLVGLARRDKIETLTIIVPHYGGWVNWLDMLNGCRSAYRQPTVYYA